MITKIIFVKEDERNTEENVITTFETIMIVTIVEEMVEALPLNPTGMIEAGAVLRPDHIGAILVGTEDALVEVILLMAIQMDRQTDLLVVVTIEEEDLEEIRIVDLGIVTKMRMEYLGPSDTNGIS